MKYSQSSFGDKGISMIIKVMFISFMFISMNVQAKAISVLGIDYQAYTHHEKLTELMLVIELELVEYYEKNNLSERQQYLGAKGMAKALGKDKPYKSIIDRIEIISPDYLLIFLDLPRNNYPQLWNIGELERLKQEKAASLKLYNALHVQENN